MDKEKILDFTVKHYGKLIGTTIGLVFSTLTLSIGFFKTLFIFLCVYIGYYLGNKVDQKENIEALLDRILPLGKFK